MHITAQTKQDAIHRNRISGVKATTYAQQKEAVGLVYRGLRFETARRLACKGITVNKWDSMEAKAQALAILSRR